MLESPRVQAAALLLLAASLIFAHLGEGHLANFDDGYYAQKAKEMVRDGHWITPHYGRQPSLDNPPLALWLMAASFLVLGVRDYAAILVSAVSGVLGVLLVHRLGRRLGYSSFGAWCSAVALLTTPYFLKYSRHAMFDVFLTLLFLLAMDAYRSAREGRTGWYLVVGLLSGLGVMTKSVLGLFPLIVVALHLSWSGRARVLGSRAFLGGVGIAALTAAPWYVYQLLERPAHFLDEHIRWLLLTRGFGGGSGAPGWTNYLGYLADLGRYGWPWLPLMVAGVVLGFRALRSDAASGPGVEPATIHDAPAAWTWADTVRLLFTWLVVVVGIMSVGREKKLWYILSAFPCLALFAGLAAQAWVVDEPRRRRVVLGSAALLGAAAIAINLGPFRISQARRPDLQQIALAAREMVPAGEKVVNFDNGYWSVNNQFFFYSDHCLTMPVKDPDEVRRALDGGAYALVSAKRAGEIARDPVGPYRVVVRSGDWALMSARAPTPVILPARDPFH